MQPISPATVSALGWQRRLQNLREEPAVESADLVPEGSFERQLCDCKIKLNGSSERAISRTTRHRSRRVLRRYIRPGEMFRENASASLGL